MKHVVLYGGAFNPVTIGHVRLAKYVAEVVKPDELWFLPCFSSVWGKVLAYHQDRLKMLSTHLLSDQEVDPLVIKVCDFEIKNELRMGTYEVLIRIMKEYPDHQFKFLIGMDQANTMKSWDNWDKLIETVPFIVANRAGYQPTKYVTWYRNKPHLYLSDYNGSEISSTMAREALSGTLTTIRAAKASEFMEPEVVKFARSRYLYPRAETEFVEDSCFFCRNQKMVHFNEHYLFCPDCSAIYTFNCFVRPICDHVTKDSPTVEREPWYKNKRESANPYIKETPITHRRICSVCAEEVEADGW
jgi:nicotinate-nucleotide adenylyltransferase